ncbi:M90 family metallopeptidase [Orrella sp. JC864]|uniref:zinc-dependent peptidase n=1 Tax=Orrella sp. JC864 TaxID=3120298 RepID=UPI0012BCD7AD
MLRWLKGAGAGRAEIDRMRARITDALWEQVLSTYPFLARLDDGERAELRARCAWLLASKHINGARGLQLNDAMVLAIAAQACLPILKLDPALYSGWNEIIVYPGGFLIPRSEQDEAGVVHEYVQEAAGEAWDGGPVVLAWDEPDTAGQEGGAPGLHAFNVVIHEFAHKLDLRTGVADGMPALQGRPGLSPRQWRAVLEQSLDAFTQALEEIEAQIPPDVDPEGPEADPWYGQLPLDPYAATDEAEFFAVSSESFFVDPAPLARALPRWYAMLAAYYGQDPLGAQPTAAVTTISTL